MSGCRARRGILAQSHLPFPVFASGLLPMLAGVASHIRFECPRRPHEHSAQVLSHDQGDILVCKKYDTPFCGPTEQL